MHRTPEYIDMAADELSIKVNIGGRTYPLTIERSEEEDIRKAAAKVEETYKQFHTSYAVRDGQDLLAMSALQIATQLVKAVESKAPEGDQEVERIHAMLREHLS